MKRVLLACLLVGSASSRAADVAVAGPDGGDVQLWAGHQRTTAVRQVPILGAIETRTDVYVLSHVVDAGGKITMVEQACRIAIRSAGGVALDFDPQAVPNIPPPTIQYEQQGDRLVATPWTGGWGDQDVDGDGTPGMHVKVKAPVCGGAIDIASNTASQATATRTERGGIRGDVAVHIDRDVLHASNPCLGLVPHHTSEQVTGTFEFVPVPAGTTCASLDPSSVP